MANPNTAATTPFDSELRSRANESCELCGGAEDLVGRAVPPASEAPSVERWILVCGGCDDQLEGSLAEGDKRWFCLREAAWSEVAAVQVVSFRVLARLAPTQGWAQELLNQLYLSDETRAWAEDPAGSDTPDSQADQRALTVDSNGTQLADGDSVTLIKDLDVKGAGFTAKRGTLVKGIRLTDDPEHVDGSVNKVAIVLKTRFLKKV